MMKNSAKTIRLFFALWPDKSVRKQISAFADQVLLKRKGRRVPDYNLHMTLHFIGNTSLENKQCLEKKAASIKSRPFRLEISKAGSFNKQGIVWLGCNRAPDTLLQLQQTLGKALAECDYVPEKRQYRPHITLFRKASLAEQQVTIKPVIWKPESFSLVQSIPVENGVRYKQIARYPFD